jgi:hypothetical protein
MVKKYKLYNGEITLEFNETTHTYTVDDKIIYGVTSIVGVLDKPALIYWAVGKAIDFLKQVLTPGLVIDEVNLPAMLEGAKTAHRKHLKDASDIGTAVHDYLERYLTAGINKEKLPPMPVNQNIKAGIKAVLEWAKENNVRFLASERKIYSKKYGYAGTLDALAEVNGKLAIVDFKTSNGIYEDYFLQTAAYARAVEEEDGKKIEECWILRIPKDGSEFATAKDEMVEMNFRSFLGCLENYKRKMYLKSKKIEEKKIKLKKIMEV